MENRCYMAMTGAEFRNCPGLPPKIAWMACHFSSSGTGLSNLPRELPEGSMLILNDRTPLWGHDPQRIAQQLEERIRALGCQCMLLDFERPGVPEAASLAAHLSAVLPCPVGVSAGCAQGLSGPVFLPPVPCHVPLKTHLEPWTERELWLDITGAGEEVILTEKGAIVQPLPSGEGDEGGFADNTLHCHYRIELRQEAAVFTLWRTEEDLLALEEEARALGVRITVGLWQELHA